MLDNHFINYNLKQFNSNNFRWIDYCRSENNSCGAALSDAVRSWLADWRVSVVCRLFRGLATFYAICHRPLIKLYWLKCFIAQRKAHIKCRSKEMPISYGCIDCTIASTSVVRAVRLNLHSPVHFELHRWSICREAFRINNDGNYRSFCESFDSVGRMRRDSIRPFFWVQFIFGSEQWKRRRRSIDETTMNRRNFTENAFSRKWDQVHWSWSWNAEEKFRSSTCERNYAIIKSKSK